MGTIGTVFLGIVVFCLLFFYSIAAIRIVRPWEKGILERLGKYQKTLGSGMHFIIPFTDRLSKVDMRENVVEVPPQEVITKDNVVVTVDPMEVSGILGSLGGIAEIFKSQQAHGKRPAAAPPSAPVPPVGPPTFPISRAIPGTHSE